MVKFNKKINLNHLIILSIAYLSTSLNLQGIQALMPFIQIEFNITRAQAGLYSSIFFFTATSAALFWGRFVDKIGAKKGMLIGVFSVGFLMLLHGLATVYIYLLILAFITGLGFSIIKPSANKAVIDEGSFKSQSLSMGIMQSSGGIGSFVGASFLPVLASIVGWRYSVITSGTFAMFVGVFIIYFLPEKGLYFNDKQKNGFLKHFKIMLKNKGLMSICLLGFVFGISNGSIYSHYTLYMTLDLNFSPALAGLMLGILQIGGVFGRIFWGVFSDYFHKGIRRKTFLWLNLLIFFVSFIYSILWFEELIWLIAILSFLLGTVAVGWMGIFFTVIGERSNFGNAGMTTGFSLVFFRTGVLLGPLIFGYIADVYNYYNYSWLAISILSLVAGITFYWQEGKYY